MTLNNTTGSQDTLISRASDSPTLQDLIEIIEDLDSRLTEAKEQIAEKDAEIERLNDELKDALNRPVE